MSVSPAIVKIFQLRTPLSHHWFRIFLPPRVFPCYPLLQWDCHLTRNPPFPRGHGGKALYEFYSILWSSQCLLVMSMVKLRCSSVLIDYLSPSMDSLKNYFAYVILHGCFCTIVCESLLCSMVWCVILQAAFLLIIFLTCFVDVGVSSHRCH